MLVFRAKRNLRTNQIELVLDDGRGCYHATILGKV